jgi:hypothetical protein
LHCYFEKRSMKQLKKLSFITFWFFFPRKTITSLEFNFSKRMSNLEPLDADPNVFMKMLDPEPYMKNKGFQSCSWNWGLIQWSWKRWET